MSGSSTILHFGETLTDPDNLYLLIPLTLIGVFLLVIRLRRTPLAPLPKPGPTHAAVIVSFAFLLIQSFHMLEHYAQVFQKFTIGQKPAHGLIGQLDLEWVHFIYNIAVFAAMVTIFYIAEFQRRDGWPWKLNSSLALIFTGGLILQGYHVLEHIVRIQQHIETGIQGTPGILGKFLELTLLHYYLNVLVYIPILFFFFGYNFHHHVSVMLFKNGYPLSMAQIPSLRFRSEHASKKT